MRNTKTMAEKSMQEIAGRNPGVAKELAGLGMACAGCPMAPFETLREACRAYRLPLRRVLPRILGAWNRSTR